MVPPHVAIALIILPMTASHLQRKPFLTAWLTGFLFPPSLNPQPRYLASPRHFAHPVRLLFAQWFHTFLSRVFFSHSGFLFLCLSESCAHRCVFVVLASSSSSFLPLPRFSCPHCFYSSALLTPLSPFYPQLASLLRRLPVDEGRLRLAVVPNTAEHAFASAGTATLPSSHLYLVLPEGLVLNYAMSRERAAAPTTPAHDVTPSRWGSILTPPSRFALAHELAHLSREDHVVRLGTAAGSLTAALATGPALLLTRLCRPPVAAAASVAATLPALMAVRIVSRRQELAADAHAAAAGYAEGGVQLWRRRIELEGPGASRTLLRDALQSHPSALQRLQALLAVMTAPECVTERGDKDDEVR